MGGENSEVPEKAQFRVLRVILTLKAAVLCAAITVFVLGGLGYALWPSPARQQTPSRLIWR